MSLRIPCRVLAIVVCAGGFTLSGLRVAAGEIDFNHDIRPILSDKCYHCHGPDADNQDSEFRLDTLEDAVKDLGGYAGIVPGDPENSELVSRIESDDPDVAMPPADAPRHLTQREKALLRQWVANGAEHDQHWAFKVPVRGGVPEDFGSQGSVPTHPELLDWLAVEFRERGWDVKAMLKLLVTSETYCQDSRTTPAMLEQDPENELLARGPRFRLSGFALRDQTLAASGLLVDKRGGPPVMPYQPAGLWEEVSAKGFKYVVAGDEGLYRRSLYTFWRRTVPPPSMMNFDTAGRETCSVNVSRTNTPLQAMNLLNDPQFVEAARALGERMMQAAKPTAEARITRGCEFLLGRPPTSGEMKVMLAGYENYLTAFQQKPEAAEAFLSVGHSPPNPELPPAELAACSAVASILFNLDETVTKE